MKEGSEILNQALSELSAEDNGEYHSLLSVIHEQWLERTGGDPQLIVSGLTREVDSGQPDDGACESLLSGYIARVAKEHTGVNGRDELTLYKVGQQAIGSYIASTTASSKSPKIMEAVEAIEVAFVETLERPEAVSDKHGALPIYRISRAYQEERERRPNPQPQTKADKLRYLDKANRKRTQIAKLKVGIKSGEVQLADVLDEAVVEKVPISVLLAKVPRVGLVKTNRILVASGITAETEVGALRNEEKAKLLANLPAPKPPSAAKIRRSSDINQVMEALRKANYVKDYRAELKSKLYTRQMTVEELFEDEIGSGMRLGEMLINLPTRTPRKNSGKVSVRNTYRATKLRDIVLSEVRIPGNKRCDKLTDKQRQSVLDCLAARDRGHSYSAAFRPFLG